MKSLHFGERQPRSWAEARGPPSDAAEADDPASPAANEEMTDFGGAAK
ncbi:hypothetical protein HNR01_002300 [Methylorubrum rhodesianum]|jgi:hypothetical protein|nr:MULTISPECIES: hypothetical protein [Methylorubrum]MBB5762674.1 hypothetical protein [Methylorubrum rhodesianum]